MRFLLDTNAVSELRKKESAVNPAVVAWYNQVELGFCCLSVITIYEIERGILLLQRKDFEQAVLMRNWFTETLDEFRGRILSLNMAGAITAAGLQVPNPRPLADTLIAATALEHNLTLVTRNVRNFLGTGVRIVNPWEA